MKLTHVVMMAVALILAAPVMSSAGEHGDHEKGHGRGKGEKGKMAGLKLTDDQKEKFKAIKEERKAAREEFQNKMESIQERLRKEVDAEKPNESTLKGLLGEMEAATAANHQKMESIKQKTKALLTPLQQAKLALKFGKEGRKHGGKRHHDDD